MIRPLTLAAHHCSRVFLSSIGQDPRLSRSVDSSRVLTPRRGLPSIEAQSLFRMRIIFAASEARPYAQTGGLSDVAAALPKALKRLGEDVAVVLPRYSHVKLEQRALEELWVPFDGGSKQCSVFFDLRDDVPIFFIDFPPYFARRRLYGEDDDAERFAFFSRAVLELAKRIGAPPDVLHCNDWMTSFIPIYLNTACGNDPFFSQTASLLTIHNIAYQGTFSPELLPKWGLPSEVYATEGGLEFHGTGCALKGGILAADAVSTVSPTYAREIQTAEYGDRLEGVLRARRNDLVGILNGVDYDQWNPETDRWIPAKYSRFDLAGKRVCKESLLARFSLSLDRSRPVLAIISRFADQKGLDLVEQAAERLLATGCALVVLGSGEKRYEDFFQWLRDRYPDRVGVYFGFNDELAHLIEAGADMLLMPSRFEPCGLTQIYSLKYGTVPIVRATGGLQDTIESFNRIRRTGNGFKFRHYNAQKLIESFYEAMLVFADPDLRHNLVANGMDADFSWERSARQYITAYHAIVSRVTGRS